MISTVNEMAPAPESSTRSTKLSIEFSVRNWPPVVNCHQFFGPLPDATTSSMPPLVIISVSVSPAALATSFSPSG